MNVELKWYSVEEKLPEPNKTVLVFGTPLYYIKDGVLDFGDKVGCVRTGEYCDVDKRWTMTSPDCDYINVYFWTHIPTLPTTITDKYETIW